MVIFCESFKCKTVIIMTILYRYGHCNDQRGVSLLFCSFYQSDCRKFQILKPVPSLQPGISVFRSPSSGCTLWVPWSNVGYAGTGGRVPRDILVLPALPNTSDLPKVAVRPCPHKRVWPDTLFKKGGFLESSVYRSHSLLLLALLAALWSLAAGQKDKRGG